MIASMRSSAFGRCDNRASQPARRPLASGSRATARTAEAGGKSELRRAVRRVTPGQGNLTDQWHRKYTALRERRKGGGEGKGEKVR